ncbi:MAG: class II aldolase/adducin family protein [Anaerovoracaceae bacterium]
MIDIFERELVLKAGKMLVASDLISRTWGNVSMRSGDSHFLITPSGREYTNLGVEEIVKVSMKDLSYEGDIKPSSEAMVHQVIYEKRPEVNFIIHTHQDYASGVSAMNLDKIPVNPKFTRLGKGVELVKYALPGSKALAKNVMTSLKTVEGQGIILKNHGAICFGKDYQEAFQASSQLEVLCREFLERRGVLFKKTQINPENIQFSNGIYSVYNNSDIVMKYCEDNKFLLPFIDDYAQIAPPKMVCDKDKGILCSSDTIYELEAIYSIVSKNCLCYFGAMKAPGSKPIGRLDAQKMRKNYIENYSKRLINKENT